MWSCWYVGWEKQNREKPFSETSQESLIREVNASYRQGLRAVPAISKVLNLRSPDNAPRSGGRDPGSFNNADCTYGADRLHLRCGQCSCPWLGRFPSQSPGVRGPPSPRETELPPDHALNRTHEEERDVFRQGRICMHY